MAFRLRRLLLTLATCAAVAGALSGRALAATPPLPDCSTGAPNTLVTPHFTVWYNSDPAAPEYITETQAGDIGGYAEHAYAEYAAMGFPAPVTGGAGRIDINVIDLTQWSRSSVVCTNGAFDFNAVDAGKVDQTVFTIGAAVFSEIEYTLFVPSTSGLWLTAGAAQWASAKALGYPAASVATIGPPDMALDCWDPNYTLTFDKCAKEGQQYGNIGLSRWPFYEYLAERYGNTFIDEVLTDAAAAGSSYGGLTAALTAHGTTVAAAFNDWTTMDLAGGYTAASLQHRVPASYASLATGTIAGTVTDKLRVTVDHLSTRYIAFTRGDGVGGATCYPATLSLTVAVPAGSLSRPTFYWTGTGGTAPIPLSINGSTATAAIPWDTCTWSGAMGILSLPNASSNPDLNSANFYVTATVSNIDLARPVIPTTTPPPPISVWGQVIPVTSAAVPPTIAVYGPEVLKLSATDKQIRLIVESNGEGSLQATLGSVVLGAGALRPGSNDLRFTVPAGLLNSLRRSFAAGNVLTLTPVSTDGVAKGTPVTRQVSIAPATTQAKPTAKAKPKAKPTKKPKPKPKPKRK